MDHYHHQPHTDSHYLDKVLKSYGELNGDLHLVEIDRSIPNCVGGNSTSGSGGSGGGVPAQSSLGLCLAGNRDLATMSVFVVGFQPGSAAALDGRIHVGDELLEVNGHVLCGRSHLNAAAIIKSVTSPRLKIILLRSKDALEHMAIPPLARLQIDNKIRSDLPSTLIPKKSKSLSMDDTQLQDSITKSTDANDNDDISPPLSEKPTPEKPTLLDLPANNNHIAVTTSPPCVTNGIPATTAGNTGEGDVSETCNSPQSKPSDVSKVSETLRSDADNTVSQSVVAAGRSKHVLQKCAPIELADDLQSPTAQPSRSAANFNDMSPQSMDDTCIINERTAHNHAIEVNSIVAKSISTAQPERTSMRSHLPSSHHPPQRLEPTESSDTSPDVTPRRAATVGACHAGSSGGHEDPSKCPIIPCRPTRISISKGKMGLGLRIIGGADTFIKSVLIYEIFEDGAAAKDNRLQPGDQLLEVSGEDLSNATHCRALRALRHSLADSLVLTVLRSSEPLCTDPLVLRTEPAPSSGSDLHAALRSSEPIWPGSELHDQLTVELVKKPGKGLGISIVGRRRNTGVVIADIVRGGTADSDGRLIPGDQILKVNGEDVSHMTQECAAALLKTLMGKVSLTISRLKPGLVPGQRAGVGCSLKKSESVISDCKNTHRQITKRRRTAGCSNGVASCIGRSSRTQTSPEDSSSESQDTHD